MARKRAAHLEDLRLVIIGDYHSFSLRPSELRRRVSVTAKDLEAWSRKQAQGRWRRLGSGDRISLAINAPHKAK